MVRPKHVVFGLIFIMMGYVLVHNERFLVEPGNPFRAHFATYGAWIWAHGLAGAAAMLLAPLQFSERLRKRYPALHRASGYVYVAGMAVLAPMGVYVQYNGETLHGFPRSFTVLAAVNAVMLFVVTGIALLFALRRRLAPHRQWMTRSYAVGLVFFEGRFILGVTGLETGGVEIVQAVIWTCLALSVPLADISNDWDELRRAATAPRRSPARVDVSARAVAAPSA
jgi:uncharacterized membrane protein